MGYGWRRRPESSSCWRWPGQLPESLGLGGWGMLTRLAACSGGGCTAPPQPPGGMDVPAECAQGRYPRALTRSGSAAFGAGPACM